MIMVERLNGEKFYINPDLIEFVEAAPDTIVSMTTGRKVVIKNTPEQLIDLIIEFRNKITLNASISDSGGNMTAR